MTFALAFDRQAEVVDGRRVRRARFERRSSLPLSAACVVANAVRETLSALLGTQASVRLLEPVIPDARGWSGIAAGAHLFAVRGTACDAAFVLRPSDALALAAAAFGETGIAERALSAVERRVLEQALRSLGGSLAPICGRELCGFEPILDISGFTTYFELLVERPAAVRLGIALSREPVLRGVGALRVEDLLDVEVEVRVEFARGALEAGTFLNLRPGTNVPMMTRMGEPGLLKLGDAVIGRGECGALGERSAILLSASA